MKILNLEPSQYSFFAIKTWKDNGYNYSESNWSLLASSKLKNDSDIIIVRLERYISHKELNYFNNLKYIISATTGLNHLDLDLFEKRNVKIISLKGHDDFLNGIPSTAEFTWGLLLSLIKKIPIAYNHVLNNGWNRDLFIGNQLKRKKIGIIGLGRTGKKVAKYAKAFEMEIFYYDPYVKNEEYNKINVLEDLLKMCDILTFHVHLNDETFHMLNKNNISKLKEDVILINTSRGEIIDQKHVLNRIIDKKIKGLATDVLENEFSLNSKKEIISLINNGYNIIVTPHIAGASFDAMRECEEYICKNFIKSLNN
jgi:D-3-phosphoglycerate dehydrogenase / 2-oxoglutarate reductase